MAPGYILGTAEKNVACDSPRMITLRERLEENKRRITEQLASVSAAIEFIDKNPGFEEFHNLVGRAGF